ncbi:relaxase/mobilization nuclease domain-containing protein, partial [bacterium]|nr:relaxase/mobilization nuclease domain-containing protein [bacterium]
MDASALGAKCEKHALHVQMRAAVGERITPDQWRDAVRRYANSFGMEEHHAAVILHLNPDGSTHCHAVFNRVHPQTLKAAHLSNNYAVHKDLAREIERDWGLERVSNQKQEQKRDYSNRGIGETQQARRAGRDVHAIRDLIRAAWERAENGEEFGHALEAGGFLLARGDRRDFLAVDEHGHPYSIGSRTTGARAAEVRAKLQDLDPATVPTLEEAREAQRQAQRERERKEGERRKAAEMEAQRQAEADRQAEAERQEQARRREAEERRKAAEIEAQQRAEAKRHEQERRAEADRQKQAEKERLRVAARQQKEERRQAAEIEARQKAEAKSHEQERRAEA